MPELSSPWRELLALLIGGGVYKLFDLLLAYLRQRAELRLAGERAEGESLERRVTATVKVIDIYQEGAEDFAERIRDLRAENRELKRQNKALKQENELLRELREVEARGPLLPPEGKG